MVGAIDPSDLIGGLLAGTGFGSSPNQIAAQNLQNQQGRQQIAANDQALQIGRLKLAGMQQAQQQQQQYQTDIQAYLANPTPGALAALITRYPDQADAIKKGWDVKDDAVRRADMGQFGAIYSALQNNKPALAINTLRQRRDAEKAQGIDTSDIDQYIEALQSGDKEAINTVKGFALAQIAAGDRDKFSEIYKTVGGDRGSKVVAPGGVLVDEEGKPLYQAPFAPQVRSVGPGETLVETQPGGGDPASSGSGSGQYKWGWTPRARNGGDNSDAAVDNKIAGMAQALGVGPDDSLSGKSPLDIARALTLSEGGAGSLADRNNNPGNIRNSDGSYKKFPTKEAGLAAAAVQVRRNLARGQTTIRQMVEGVPAGGAARGGGARVIAQGAPKQGYQLLTPQEASQLGLDANVRYQRSPDGQITALGGQSRAQLKPLPQQVLSARADNQASIANIDRALSLLDPKNNSQAAKDARGAIGFGTGGFGLWDPNRSDPHGADFRALIGQIGGIIIKDISGAAVSAAEDDRLKKWIPVPTDSAATIRAKLNNLRREIGQRNSAIDKVYNEGQGYRPFTPSAPANVVTVRTVQQAQRLAPGTLYRAPDGKVRRR